MTASHPYPFGKFINASPLRCEWIRSERSWLLWSTDVWEYIADETHPMTYVHPDFCEIRPGARFLTDFGSIPPPLRGLPSLSSTLFLGPYLIHDDGCRNGGLWVRQVGRTLFHFVHMDRLEMDSLLKLMIRASPWDGSWRQAELIYAGVRVGAAFMPFPTEKAKRKILKTKESCPVMLVEKTMKLKERKG